MDQSKVLIWRKEARVQAVINQKHVQELKWMFGNYCTCEVVKKLENDIWTVFEEKKFYQKGEKDNLIREKSPDGPDNVVLLNKDKKSIIIAQGDARWNLFYTFRMVRNLLRWSIYDESVAFFHGGAVEINGSAIAFLGNKKAGKTSSILSMIIAEHTNYIANDDLMLSFEERIWAYGWPRTLSVRKDTISMMGMKNEHHFSNESHPSNVYLRENGCNSENEYFFPIEISRLGNVDIIPKAELKIVIFTEFDENVRGIPEIMELETEVMKKKLLENFRVEPEKYCAFLREYFEIPNEKIILKKIDILCNSIKAYKIKQSFNQLDKTSKCIRELLEMEGNLNEKEI